jgi:Asp-tRNA(Asn)/Glu-tRNA(Gln) amidotransferase B subunit
MLEQQLMRDIVREAVHQNLRSEATIKKLVKEKDTKKSLSKMYVDLIVKAVLDVNK